MSEAKKRRSTGRVTLNDVAQLAGVGAMTVSRALRTPELVSDKMRERIDAAVDELGYIPNRAAGALASGTSHVILVIVPSLLDRASAELMAGLQPVLMKAGYQLVLGDAQHLRQQSEQLEHLLQYNPAAVIVLGCLESPDDKLLLRQSRLPVVEVGALVPHPMGICIGGSNQDAGYRLTRHMIERGYRNIGFLCARQEQWMLQQRMRGWQQAMLESYLSPDMVINTSEAPSFSTGAAMLGEFLMRWPELDALICVNDELAAGVLFECQRRHLNVPGKLAIAGFDDSDVAKACYPALTSVHIPYRKMGSMAAEIILRKLAGEELQECTQLLEFQLQKRQSS
ncbi:LacI family DNA-binding transcriptional regulator [Aeromonas piscicola]|jgi:DNA-binding LacI/PurR family transcriptional regulator|uniref:LacI family transcriptional regulator n=1 Tax=Aeromonas piscicola TaxID=600645 RepID=A0ABT7QIQ2_9GAMM|nr:MULTISPECIES: LacI family DNA-binding transcriptional regulator [Aeromonas]MCX7134522.1 LacI family DNA-binding transcriptional regulator [Aeromonas sp.]MDM5133828.1 LacI family transcriptional regulator [Aeromonas piscicola]